MNRNTMNLNRHIINNIFMGIEAYGDYIEKNDYHMGRNDNAHINYYWKLRNKYDNALIVHYLCDGSHIDKVVVISMTNIGKQERRWFSQWREASSYFNYFHGYRIVQEEQFFLTDEEDLYSNGREYYMNF